MDQQLIDASENGNVDKVRRLLEAGANPAAYNNEAIRLAAENGHTEVVRLLLADPRVNPAAGYNKAIRSAITDGHTKVVRLLLADPRVDPAADNNDAIRRAERYGYTEIVQLLASQPGVLLPTANFYLQTNQQKELKRLAKMTGAFSNSPGDLMVWGAAIGSLPLVKSLIEQGVDVTFANNSAMVAAKQYGQPEIISYLESMMKL